MMSVKKKKWMKVYNGCPVCAVTLHLHPPHSRESHTDTQEKSHGEPSWPYNTYTSQVSDPMVAARSPVGAGPYIRQYSSSSSIYKGSVMGPHQHSHNSSWTMRTGTVPESLELATLLPPASAPRIFRSFQVCSPLPCRLPATATLVTSLPGQVRQ